MRKYILPILGIVLIALSVFSFTQQSIEPVLAEETVEEEVPPEPGVIDNGSGLWDTMKNAVGTITGAIGESISQLVSKFFTAIGDFLVSTICPQCTTGGREMAKDESIPESMRLGLTGIVEREVTAMFNAQPNIDVVAHLSEEWVPGYKEKQSVYASGYDDLRDSGIDSLWSLTRNIAYIGFVVVMIVIGFMIMFRNKIGGQTIVTIGNAIPKVVVGLVLVTFSFAIAGILLDISGIFMRVTAGVLQSDIPIYNIMKLLIGTALTEEVAGGIAISGIVGAIIAFFTPVGWIAFLLALPILAIVLIGAIKLWFTLVKTYLSLLVNVVVAPLAIMVGSIPGSEAMTTNIFKSMLRNSLVFPLAFAIVNLPHFLAGNGERISLAFPETVFQGAHSAGGLGDLMMAVAEIVAIFAAAQAPEFVKAIIPPTASKSGADVAGAIKKSLSGIPLVGGMLGGK